MIITMHASFDGVSVEVGYDFDDEQFPLKDAVAWLRQEVIDNGGTPVSPEVAASRNGTGGGNGERGEGPPADAPSKVKDAWLKLCPTGKTEKGKYLGTVSDKSLEFFADPDFKMADIRKAANILIDYREEQKRARRRAGVADD